MTEASIGHNSAGADGILKSYVERIERLAVEKAQIAEDISEIYKEAKGTGFDARALRTLIARRKMEAVYREEQDALLETYERVFG